MVQTVHLSVIGETKIHCASCEQRIAKALRRLPGVRDVSASAANQRVAVTLDPDQVGADEVLAKLEQIGYEAKLQQNGG